jgi:hypothetical protein
MELVIGFLRLSGTYMKKEIPVTGDKYGFRDVFNRAI